LSKESVERGKGRKPFSGLVKSTAVVSLFTIISRITGLIREQVRANYLGTGHGSDAFAIASMIPNMLQRMFGDGAMTPAFIPVFKGLQEEGDKERLSKFFSGFMTLFTLLMLAVTLLGILLAAPIVENFFTGRFIDEPGKVELTISLTRVMFPFLFLISIAALIQGTLNSYNIFGPSAFAPVLLNLVNIGVVIFFWDSFPDAAYALAVGFIVGGFIQLAFQVPFLRGKGLKFIPTLRGFKDPAVREVGRIFLPGVFAQAVYIVNVTVSQAIAVTLEHGSVSALQYSLRLQELVLGVFAVAVATVILPTMSAQAKNADFVAVKDTLQFSLKLLGVITIPASVGLMLLGKPITSLLFKFGQFNEESIRMTAFALYFHAAGIFFIAAQRNIVQVFFAMKDTRTPAKIAFVVMILHVGLCYLLAGPLRHGGLALAGSIAALANAGILYFVLRERIGRLNSKALFISLGKMLVASLIMAVLILLALYAELLTKPLRPGAQFVTKAGLLLRLTWIITAAIITYILAAKLLKIKELEELFGMLSRKLRRRSKAKSQPS